MTVYKQREIENWTKKWRKMVRNYIPSCFFRPMCYVYRIRIFSQLLSRLQCHVTDPLSPKVSDKTTYKFSKAFTNASFHVAKVITWLPLNPWTSIRSHIIRTQVITNNSLITQMFEIIKNKFFFFHSSILFINYCTLDDIIFYTIK